MSVSRFLPRGVVARVALFAIILLIVVAIVAPLIWSGAAARSHVLKASQGSSAEHWFGTDQLGRDIFYKSLVATRLSVVLAFLASAIGVAIGIPLGVLPAVIGDRSRRFVASAIAAIIALPGLLLAMFVATIIGVGATGAVLGIGIANAPVIARLAQTLSASVAGRDYVAAARMLGASRTKMLLRHIIPNIAEPLILLVTITTGACLIEIATLSFLGLGVRPPSYDWGALLNEGLQAIYVTPMGAVGPGLFVVYAGLSFALIGESLSLRATRLPAVRGGLVGRTPRAAAPGTDDGYVLRAEDLSVRFPAPNGRVLTAVNNISLDVRSGEKVGIVGESGSGKTQTALALAQLVDYPGAVDWSALRFQGVELATAGQAEHRRLLGAKLAMVSQDPMTALNPALRVGKQLAEVATVHLRKSRREAMTMAATQLAHVQISDPAKRIRQFPYEFSGGMRQRAAIAMGLVGEPQLIIADEPTTALDVTVQQQVLDLLDRLNQESGTAIVLISHDIAVVTNLCDRVLVMYGGRIVEDAGVDDLLADAAHPYARALLAAVPTMTSDRDTDLVVIPGRPPTLADMPPGCPFVDRCAFADDRCRSEMPPLEEIAPGRKVACWHPQGSFRGSLPTTVALRKTTDDPDTRLTVVKS